MPAFAGWTGDFQGFFLGLRLDNSKAYFEAHRKQYEVEVKAPMLALLAGLEAEFGPARLSRPNRDIRFSADKSPYKTNIYASCQGGYVALDAEGLTAAGGRYQMEPAEIERFRAAAAAGPGEELAAAVEELRRKGYQVDEPQLKRVPAPYPKDHPRGELLRHKRLIYWRRWEIEGWIATPEVKERVATVWRDGASLARWFGRHLNSTAAPH